MTNRENILMALKDEHDSVIAYDIACPHRGYEKGLPCDGKEYPWSKLHDCGKCIAEWLDQEVET